VPAGARPDHDPAWAPSSTARPPLIRGSACWRGRGSCGSHENNAAWLKLDCDLFVLGLSAGTVERLSGRAKPSVLQAGDGRGTVSVVVGLGLLGPIVRVMVVSMVPGSLSAVGRGRVQAWVGAVLDR